MPNKVLVVVAHPALEASVANRRMARSVAGLEGVVVHDLYETYPDFEIAVTAEQDLLVAHDVIILLHPLYWYSAPALLKEWLDLVLEHGFAYGRTGNALVGKILMNALSTGGQDDAYNPEGRNRFTIRQLLAPFDQTAHLCGMIFLPPFIVYRGRALSGKEMAEHAVAFRRCVIALRDGSIDIASIVDLDQINADLDMSESARASLDNSESV
ncbi:MAG: NAD(P)H-dependent oxidoreductase [Alphaproteobacteria bacterium]